MVTIVSMHRSLGFERFNFHLLRGLHEHILEKKDRVRQRNRVKWSRIYGTSNFFSGVFAFEAVLLAEESRFSSTLACVKERVTILLSTSFRSKLSAQRKITKEVTDDESRQAYLVSHARNIDQWAIFRGSLGPVGCCKFFPIFDSLPCRNGTCSDPNMPCFRYLSPTTSRKELVS